MTRNQIKQLIIAVIAASVCSMIATSKTLTNLDRGQASKQTLSGDDLSSSAKGKSTSEKISQFSVAAHANSGNDSSGAFQDYYALSKKVVMTEEERHRFRELLGDPRLIDASKTALQADSETDWSMVAQEQRLHHVDFLIHAMEWEQNPVRYEAVAAAREIVLRDLSTKSVPYMQKKSLAGDQIELYQALERTDSTTVQEMKANAHGFTNKLIAFAIANEERK